jgi:2-phospho-L-lactate transferase/gluconeogenesis factor (CofD/UPF0052 family)
VETFEIELANLIGFDSAVEIVEAPERVVRLGGNVPTPTVIRIEREFTRALDAAAEVAINRGVHGALVPNAGKLDAITAAR